MQKDVEDPEESPPWNDDSSDGQLDLKLFDHWTQKLRTWGVESRGASPSSVWVVIGALIIRVCAISRCSTGTNRRANRQANLQDFLRFLYHEFQHLVVRPSRALSPPYII